MDELKNAFYNVMYKYKKNFSEQGVMANLEAWRQNKEGLITLLRQHPAWVEEELAIVFKMNEGRSINTNDVDECRYEMAELANEVIPVKDNYDKFLAGLNLATNTYSKNIPESIADAICISCGIKCVGGQKTSRVINKLCKKYGVTNAERFNPVFARLSDSLNPIEILKTGVLSVHPCDFLEMSNQDNTWRSCHRLDGGSYQAGCLSYLIDSTSMIFFSVDDHVTSEFYKHPKITREIFCFKDNILLQSRLYPSDNDTQRTQYRQIVQGAISECIKSPNLWKTLRGSEIAKYIDTHQNSEHYPDYVIGYGIVSLLKGAASYGVINIGAQPLCVCCGKPYNDSSYLKCNCIDVVVCSDCGETVLTNDAHYHEGVWLCKNCLHICNICGTFITDQIRTAQNRYGKTVILCDRCSTSCQELCAGCSVYSICQTIGAVQFCSRTEIQIPRAA